MKKTIQSLPVLLILLAGCSVENTTISEDLILESAINQTGNQITDVTDAAITNNGKTYDVSFKSEKGTYILEVDGNGSILVYQFQEGEPEEEQEIEQEAEVVEAESEEEETSIHKEDIDAISLPESALSENYLTAYLSAELGFPLMPDEIVYSSSKTDSSVLANIFTQSTFCSVEINPYTGEILKVNKS